MYLSSSGKKGGLIGVAILLLRLGCDFLQDAFTIAWRHGPFVNPIKSIRVGSILFGIQPTSGGVTFILPK
jgi:hypothetical protein